VGGTWLGAAPAWLVTTLFFISRKKKEKKKWGWCGRMHCMLLYYYGPGAGGLEMHDAAAHLFTCVVVVMPDDMHLARMQFVPPFFDSCGDK
jgi:hypothetical protein